MGNSNYSSVLFKELENLKKNTARQAAKKVAHVLGKQEEAVEQAKAALSNEKDKLKKLDKQIKKYKKSGDLRDLSIFGI